MERIHAILSDGTIVTDVEVFRYLYEAVGLGWVYAATKYEPVLRAANAAYSVWAKYRTQLTGREAMEVIMQRRKALLAGQGAAGSLCKDEDVECALPVTTAAGANQQKK
jgi:predicted DCC family thiol-disulfide oxidoreductase YuxK